MKRSRERRRKASEKREKKSKRCGKIKEQAGKHMQAKIRTSDHIHWDRKEAT